MFTAIQEEPLRVGIRVHDGKTQLWNRSGVVLHRSPSVCGASVMVLGTPMGHPEFVRSRLAAVSAKHDRLVSQIVGMSDLQCAWLLLLHCASAQPNYMLRVVHPALSAGFAGQLVAAPPCNMYWDARWIGPSKCSSDS